MKSECIGPGLCLVVFIGVSSVEHEDSVLESCRVALSLIPVLWRERHVTPKLSAFVTHYSVSPDYSSPLLPSHGSDWIPSFYNQTNFPLSGWNQQTTSLQGVGSCQQDYVGSHFLHRISLHVSSQMLFQSLFLQQLAAEVYWYVEWSLEFC
jgi:hypothetical protein